MAAHQVRSKVAKSRLRETEMFEQNKPNKSRKIMSNKMAMIGECDNAQQCAKINQIKLPIGQNEWMVVICGVD